MNLKSIFSAGLLTMMAVAPLAQQPNRDSLINIQVSQSISAVNYRVGGSTRIGFSGTALLPQAKGGAKVTSRSGVVHIQASFAGLETPQSFGPEYLVYVLWAVTPEGRATNLGELTLKGHRSKLDVTTRLQSFGLMVSAEPYFAVSYPSQKVVLANVVLKGTKGAVSDVAVNTELLQRGNYSDAAFRGYTLERRVPLDLYEARNAVRIAALESARLYAPEAFAKAEQALSLAAGSRARESDAVPMARQAVQAAEDARSIAVARQQQASAAARQLASQHSQEAAERARQLAENQAAREAEQRNLAEREKATSMQQKEAADAAAAKAVTERAASESAALRAHAQARKARIATMQAIADKEALRQRLLAKFNRVLPTTDTPRGLVVNLDDVLFDTGKSELRPAARIALARLSGILANYPALNLSIEGHTDSTGTSEFNQKLSERRAEAVRAYIVGQQSAAQSTTVTGLGQFNPVDDNATAEGRQRNRRVEIVISGEVIGSTIGF